jgi:hypothetical protein
MRIRVIMPAIIDQAGRPFNVDEADGMSRRPRILSSKSALEGERKHVTVLFDDVKRAPRSSSQNGIARRSGNSSIPDQVGDDDVNTGALGV